MKNKKQNIIIIVLAIILIALLLVYYLNFRQVTVTYTLKLGAGIPAEGVRVGSVISEPDTPTYEGYLFKGWYLDGEEYDFSKPVTKSITLEAKWEKID